MYQSTSVLASIRVPLRTYCSKYRLPGGLPYAFHSQRTLAAFRITKYRESMVAAVGLSIVSVSPWSNRTLSDFPSAEAPVTV